MNGQRLEETIYVALSQLLYLWGEEVGGLKLSHGGKGKKPQRRETFMGRHKKTTQGVDH